MEAELNTVLRGVLFVVGFAPAINDCQLWNTLQSVITVVEKINIFISPPFFC